MNYKIINQSILSTHDVPEFFSKEEKFYDYLLSNNVAYYYSKVLSKENTSTEKKIIAAGDKLNEKYIKTLKLIEKIGKDNEIKILLFKTYKYFSEVVDGDIDLFLRKKDFHLFLKALEEEGFKCWEHEKLKAVCYKKDFCNIEPRVSASFHGIVVLNESQAWEKVEEVTINGIKILKTTKEVDLFYLLLNNLYGPNYLRLYLLLLYKQCDLKKLFALSSAEYIKDLQFLINSLITNDKENNRFPLFLGNINYISWWLKRILPNDKLTMLIKLKLILFFLYSKYLFIFFDKLVFRHQWPFLKKNK